MRAPGRRGSGYHIVGRRGPQRTAAACILRDQRMTATTCPRCGQPMSPGSRFCTRCGADISGAQGNVATAYVNQPDLARATAPEAALLDLLRQATLGEYDVQAELGRGGMAAVFLAHDIALDRKVAVKVMSPALLTGQGMAERFKREARTAASLSHPNIIRS